MLEEVDVQQAVVILTVFAGLMTGTVPVEVAPGPGVAVVELLLDGAPVAVLDRPPWRAEVDLGAAAPHELVAVARSADGDELGRDRQLVNVRPGHAAVRLAVSPAPGGHVADVAWDSFPPADPTAWEFELDGAPLEVTDPARTTLPTTGDGPHVLRVELSFPGGRRASAETVIGVAGGDVRTDLTAVALAASSWPRRLSAATAAGWLEASGEPAPVAAVEASAPELLVVRDPAAVAPLEAFDRMLGHLARRGPGSERSTRERAPSLPSRHRLRLLVPMPEVVEHRGREYRAFPVTSDLNRAGDLPAILARAPRRADPAGAFLAEAVAVAGMEARSSGRPGAVLLVLDAGRRDPGLAASARFLEQLHVPLVVWTVGEDAGAPALPAVHLGGAADLRKAVRDLSGLLDRQRIVWVVGRHLPNDIRLAATAPEGVTLAGG